MHGIPEEGKLNLISSTMGKVLNNGQPLLAYLFMINSVVTNDQEQVDEAIQEVLEQYDDAFDEPMS